jgi:carboxypeptidase Taq
VDADEVTYNLHIMLRVEMELELLAGRISVRDAPTAWNEKMQSYLGITPPTHTLGILQDVHWSSGMMGYFMTYSLGNILSVQFFDAAIRAHPEIPAEMRDGKFDTLRSWLAQHVYLHGRMFDPGDLIERATGQPLTIEPYLSYLRAKFGEIYDL